jgi:small multidrug resistance pump
MSNLISALLVIFLAGVGVLGDYFIKLSGSGSKYIIYHKFFIGMFIYSLSSIGWFFAMKHMKLGVLGVFYSLTTVILLAIVGAIFFRENLSIYDFIGIILGIISIIILARFG